MVLVSVTDLPAKILEVATMPLLVPPKVPTFDSVTVPLVLVALILPATAISEASVLELDVVFSVIDVVALMTPSFSMSFRAVRDTVAGVLPVAPPIPIESTSMLPLLAVTATDFAAPRSTPETVT